MSYASLINPFSEYHVINSNNKTHNSPNAQAEDILLRHELESHGSQYPEPTHEIVQVGQADFHVNFYYPDNQAIWNKKVFNGKHWE